MSTTVEIEVKFYLSEIDAIRNRILAIGATFLGRHFETNTCFENANRSFRAQDILLRLRKDNKNRLTFKAPPAKHDRDFKVYREMEVQVDDFDTCQRILESLGFQPEQTYEKWRETFVLEDTKLLLDTTPCGSFLEIEGPKSHIMELANRLGLKWHERILLNYLAIFDIVRRQEKLSFHDMTFDNFSGRSVTVETYLSLLRP